MWYSVTISRSVYISDYYLTEYNGMSVLKKRVNYDKTIHSARRI